MCQDLFDNKHLQITISVYKYLRTESGNGSTPPLHRQNNQPFMTETKKIILTIKNKKQHERIKKQSTIDR